MKTQILKLNLIFTFVILFFISIHVPAQKTSSLWPNPIVYDDGSAEDYVAWNTAGGIVAVKFTSPYGYPIIVIGGELYVGDGSFPEGGDFMGTNFLICLFDDDGINNMPGTMLDSAYIEVNNYEWIEFDSIFSTVITDGDFYIGMKQLVNAPNCAPIGVDTDLPSYYNNSYAKPVDGEWDVSPYQDFMIRAYVTNVTGINNIINNENIAVYPNPAIKNISISSEKKINEIRIIDLQGKEVLKVENLDSEKYNVDVSGLKEGTYFVRIVIDNNMVSRKLLIAR